VKHAVLWCAWIVLLLASGCGAASGGDTGGVPDVPAEVLADAPAADNPAADVPAVDTAPDLSADCGPAVCYDCACDCGCGMTVPYGGCFGGCEPVPAHVKDCSSDCSGMCPNVDCDVPDAGHEDVPADACTPAVCIDCACTCPDGSFQKYGGCFEACEAIPQEIATCTKSCLEVCGDVVTSTPCPSGKCPEGYECVEAGCADCGIPPSPVCVPAPCSPDGCWIEAHCPDGSRCVGASPTEGRLGQCLADTVPPVCWSESDCPPVANCVDPVHCPVCTACAMVTAPGTCRVPQPPGSPYLWVPGDAFVLGKAIAPAWFNFSAGPVYIQGCTSFTIERLDAATGAWVYEEDPYLCTNEGVARKIEADGALVEFEFAAPSLVPVDGPIEYRLAGQYWTGCTDGLPISGAACQAGPFDVPSNVFLVVALP
jgi:hypothetical protein